MTSRPSETDRPLLPIRALGLPPIPGVAMNDTRLDDTWELYDVSTDVGPAHDLVADHPDKLKVGPASRAPAATETTRLHGGLPRPRAGRPERNELPLIGRLDRRVEPGQLVAHGIVTRRRCDRQQTFEQRAEPPENLDRVAPVLPDLGGPEPQELGPGGGRARQPHARLVPDHPDVEILGS